MLKEHSDTAQRDRMHKASEHLPLILSLAFGLQVAACISSIIVIPFVVSSQLCAASQTYNIRSRLTSLALIISGFSTIIQTQLGMRLPLLQGPSYTFLPIVHTYLTRNQSNCNYIFTNNSLSNSEYEDKLAAIAGNLMASSAIPLLAGATGFVGAIRRFVGPITVATMLFLVMYSTTNIAIQYMSLHWFSLIQTTLLLLIIFYFYSIECPVLWWKNGKLHICRSRIFERYPYLIAFAFTWALCLLCTIADLTPANSTVRLDRDGLFSKISNAQWIFFPTLDSFGKRKFDAGLIVGCSVAAISTVIETIGTYYAAAEVSQEPIPPSHALNRGMIVEGIGTFLAGFFAVGSGICTFSGNVGIMEITKIATRSMMVAAGLLLILIGFITKIAMIFATIPDPLIGAVVATSSATVMGIALANLEQVDMSLTRNKTVLGWSLMAGIAIPKYIDEYPIKTGNEAIDEIVRGFMSLPMFVGPMFAFILDNTVSGASRKQRGFRDDEELTGNDSVYRFPKRVMRCLNRIPIVRSLPFIPGSETSRGS